MKRVLLLLPLILMTMSCSKINPFFAEWDTPYGIPPFEEIKESDYIRAVKFGIRQQSGEIDAIIANEHEPTFENTVVPYEQSGKILSRVTAVLYNLSESDGTPAMNRVMDKALPLLSEHSDNIFMNPYFFERVKVIYETMNEAGLNREQKMVVKKLYNAFYANGIALDEAGQARMREINSELAMLHQTFGNNLLSQTNAFKLRLTDSAEVVGLPEAVLEAAASEAIAAGENSTAEGGPWVFTLQNQSYVPFMTYSARRDLREQMFRAYSSRGNNGDKQDNKSVVLRLMQLRIEKAQLLGYRTPAEFILSDKMAGTPKAVDDFLARLFAPANAKASAEVVDMQAIMDEDIAAGILPDDGTSVIRPWDWAYYAEKVRQRKYALDESEIKPYFKMENVREGVFALAHEMYGLNFEVLDSIPKYHPEVEGFKVTDADGSLIGVILTDYYPRSTKRGGAWMSEFKVQEITPKGENIRPVIINVGNFTKPTQDRPSLLTLDEVGTMFHEFGHALHGLLSQCTYPDVSGTSVAKDFVELPSQFNENWALDPAVLAKYARHYETGEVIPDSLVAKIANASKFNYGFMTTELVAASILDMRWHELTSIYVPADSPFASDEAAPKDAAAASLIVSGEEISLGASEELRVIDPMAFEAWAMTEAGLIEQIIPRYRTTYFNHIFGSSGYSAGYYSYLWAEVLDKDAFEHFQKVGMKQAARSFRQNILEKGGSEEPMTLYKRFRGSEPDASALLRARGLE